MRVVLVTGSRDLRNHALVYAELDKLHPDLVIHGDARGVDAAADTWARNNCASIISWAANWQRAGKAAGAIRNAQLVSVAYRFVAAGDAVVCLAMPGPKSIGTHDCARKAARAGLRVIRVDVP